MIRRWLAVAVCVLVAFTPMAATPRERQTDPISGAWSGEIVPDSGKRFVVTLELTFNGKTSVSGTISGLPGPADVKTGTFDPKTGALRLQLGPVGSPTAVFTLDGTVVHDTARGRAIDASGEGTFAITRKT